MNKVVIVILIIILLGLAGVGWWYYSGNSRPSGGDGGSGSGTDGGGSGSSGTGGGSGPIDPSSSDCTDAFTLKTQDACLSTDTAGISWDWGDTPISQACKNKVDKYVVNLSSSWNSDFVLTNEIKSANTMQTGITNIFSPFLDGTQLTFNVQPFSKNGALTTSPAKFTMNKANNTQDCNKVGLKGLPAVPNWNVNKNLFYIKGHNTSPARGAQIRTYTKDNVQLDRGTTVYNGYVERVMPVGGHLTIGCTAQGAYTDAKWSWNDLNAQKPPNSSVLLTGDCHAGDPHGWKLSNI